MRAHNDQSNQNSKHNASSVLSIKREGEEGTAQLLDNRKENTLQKKLNNLVDKDPKSQKTAQLKSLANDFSEDKKIIQKKDNKTGLPDTLKSGMENLSGQSMDDVKVHYNSSKPAEVGAHSYAQGHEIHLSPGREKDLPHETAHVAQQKEGRVKPTKSVNGMPVNDNPSLEKEADNMGAKALQMKINLNVHSKVTKSNLSNTIQRNPDDLLEAEETLDLVDTVSDDYEAEEEVDFTDPQNGSLGLTPLQDETVKGSKTKFINSQIAEYNDSTSDEDGLDTMQKYGKARRTLHKINTAIETWMAKKSKTHTKERIKQMEALKSSVHNEFVKIDNFVTNNQDRYETNEDKDIETFDKKHGSKYNAPVEVATHRFRIHEKDADKITGRGDSKEDKSISSMHSKMTGIVKDMQRKEGTIKATDQHVQADAGTNAFLAKLFEEDNSNSIEAKNNFANDILKQPFLNSISDGGVKNAKNWRGKKVLKEVRNINPSALANYKTQSERNSKISHKRVLDSEADIAIVQMFFNRTEKLKKESAKNKTNEPRIKNEVKDIIEYSVNRQNNVQKRFKSQDLLNDQLEDEGRIASLGDRIKGATGAALKKVFIKILTLGFGTYRNKNDSRGMKKYTTIKRKGEKDRGVFDFSLDEEGELHADKIKGGGFGHQWPHEEIMRIHEEANRLSPELFGTGNYAAGVFMRIAEGLSIIKSIVTTLSEIIGTLAVTSAALSLSVVLAPIFVPFGILLTSIALWSRFIKAGLSGLIASFNGLAQLENTNPALFNRLEGRSIHSGIEFLAEGASVGVTTGLGLSDISGVGTDSGRSLTERLDLSGIHMEDGMIRGSNLANGEIANASNSWGMNHRLIQGGVEDASYRTAMANNIIADTGGSIAAETGLGLTELLSESVDSNEVSDSYKGKKGSHSETISSKEAEAIRKSIADTRAKMKKDSKSVYGYFIKGRDVNTNEEVIDTSETTSEDKKKVAGAKKVKKGFRRTSNVGADAIGRLFEE